ncbi:MAG TPA: DUF4175 family protein [Tepidisphaeraceae bacterium]|nr:DUF4175 family protein [Tepidisphaeraceae bacterium]
MAPLTLIDSLQAVRRKVRVLAIAVGANLAVAAFVGLLVATVFVDWSLGLDWRARLLLMIAAGASLLYLIWRRIVTPARSKLALGDVAGFVEHRFPKFDDRLRSTVGFAQGEVPGSETMKQRVVTEATDLARGVDLEQVILRRPVYYTGAGAVASVAVLALLMTWGGKSGWLHIAANRLMLGSEQWPRSVEIKLESAVPQRVPVGQRVPVKIRLTKGDKASRKAVIHYRYDQGPWQSEVMTHHDGVYTAMLDARLEQGHKSASLQVRLEAGDDEMSLAPVAVVPRLEVAGVSAAVTPPAYVQPSVATNINLADRPAVMAYGSQVVVRIAFNKTLKESAPVELKPAKEGQKLPPIKWDRATPGVAIAHFQADAPLRFGIKGTDTDGFQNAGGEEYELIVKEDEPPSIQIEEPKRSEDRPAVAGFDIKAAAEDDYGILGAQLVIDRVSTAEKSTDPAAAAGPGGPNHWMVDLVKNAAVAAPDTTWEPADTSPERKRYRLGYHWELASLDKANLKPGDVLEYFIQVKDNFNLNGKQHDWVPSGKLRITIISQSEWERQAQAIAEAVQQQIKAEHMSELRQKAETETLKKGLDRNKKFDAADKAQAERLSNDQSGSQSQTMQLADRLAQLVRKMAENKSPEGGLKQTAAQVEKDLRQAADSPMRDAKQNLDAAKNPPQDPKANADQQTKDAQQRALAMNKATQSQQQAADQLQKAMDRLGEMGGLSDLIQKFQQARDKQDQLEKKFQDANKNNIGKKPEELSKEDQDQIKKQSDEQKEQAKQLDQLIANTAAKAEKSTKSDPAAAEAMKQAAQIGKTQALPSKQQQAAQDMQQNQQAQAQSNQRQVELGLDQILNKLKEAEHKRLEELSRQLAQIQQLVAELIERQAGHNIDNLLIQGGPKRVEQLDSKERDELIELAARDPKNLPGAPGLESLSASQEQTQRNCRDIAKQAESLPDPSASAKLTQAAGDMERAIIHLRENKLPEAYQPPQVDALATLIEAKQKIDAALKDVNKQIEEKDTETLKQAYVELLKSQKKIGADVVAIDKSPRDNGDLPREQAVRLGQLPGDQGKQIDKAQKLGKDLQKLDSIVFSWANKDIVKAMGQVKDNLAKPETGKPTQVAERHTEEQIQAMIDSLVEKLDKKKFDDRNNGGGGGGKSSPQAKLPSEAELRLLKKNQQSINTGTIEQDKQKEKDKPELQDLGARQGDIRNLLDRLLQKASQGKIKLRPEPDPKDQLPEEASKEDIDNKEIQDDLLNDKVTDNTAGKDVKVTGDRMARSRQRLALNDDPGKVTQEIQKRIIIDIDALIQMAQQQQAQSKPGQGKGQRMGKPKPQPGQGQQQTANGNQPPKEGGTNAAQKSALGQAGSNLDPSANVREALDEWGKMSKRDRPAVQEGATDKPLGKYEKLVEDYYRSLAEQASKR